MKPYDDDTFEFNPGIPAVPRVIDYIAGRKDNYTADREIGDKILSLAPYAWKIPGWNRRFLDDAIGYAARQGVTQFVDIGAGMPLPALNTHEVAFAHHKTARTVYVDKDRVAVTHLCSMRRADPPQTVVMEADLKDPKHIMTSPDFNKCIDLSQPTAVVLGLILHFLPGQQAYDVTEYIKRGLAPGSYLIISHATADGLPEDLIQKAKEIYDELDPLTYRSRDEVASFFDGWELAEPGVTDINDWRPAEKTEEPTVIFGGVACKPHVARLGASYAPPNRRSGGQALIPGRAPHREAATTTENHPVTPCA